VTDRGRHDPRLTSCGASRMGGDRCARLGAPNLAPHEDTSYPCRRRRREGKLGGARAEWGVEQSAT